MKKIYTSLFYAFLFLNNFSLNSYFKHSLSLSKTHDRIRGFILNLIKKLSVSETMPSSVSFTPLFSKTGLPVT